jgi:glycosyltransferase involved in cell wall biosynthesis
MRVLFATEYYHPFTPGGTPWSLRLLARELVAAGHPVTIVTPNYGAAPDEELDGAHIVRFPIGRRLAPGPSLAPVRDHVDPRFHLRLARAIVRAARAHGADVVHAQEKHALVGAFLAARYLRLPVYVTLRDYGLLCPIATCLLTHEDVPADCSVVKLERECASFYLDRYIRGGLVRRVRVRAQLALLYLDARLKGLVLSRVDGVIGVSEAVLEIYRRAGRVRHDAGTVVYNVAPPSRSVAVDDAERARVLAAFGLPDRPLVLYVGKRSPGKGFPVFIEAVRRVARRAPTTCFVVVGDGAEPTAVADADLRYLGSLGRDELDRLYALADLVVQPAVWPEPFSRVPLEAAAHGKPVVGTRSGGMPEAIVHDVTGLLVERGDAQALSDAIVTLLDDAALRRTLGAGGRAFVERRFGGSAILPVLLAAYRRRKAS